MPAATKHDARVGPAEWDASVRALLAAGRPGEALETLRRAAEVASGPDRFGELLALFGELPPVAALGEPGEHLHLRLLGNRPGGAALVEERAGALLAAGRDWPFLHACLAWALAQRAEDAGALAAAAGALAHAEELTPRERQWVWRAQGQALARLNRPGWEAAYTQAAAHSQGRARGIVLTEWGALRSRGGDRSGAMALLAEAHDLLRGDAQQAWPLNTMGLTCLHGAQLAEAEHYFGEMVRVQRRGGPFLSRALSGQAAARRALGEWERALALYREAEAAALRSGDEDDRRQALRGQGHTLRLAGAPLRAQEPLALAAVAVQSDRERGESWVNVDRAAALLAVPDSHPGEVQALLDRSGPLGREDGDRAAVVRAELARRRGDRAGARTRIAALDPTTLWAREEAHAFAALFALLPPGERPQPLPRPQRTAVRLRAIGWPELTVNGRRQNAPEAALVALAALLDADGQLCVEDLAAALDDGRPRSGRQAAQRASKAVTALRGALGWPGSVLAERRQYRLDPSAHWGYDVAEALAARRRPEGFLRGVTLPWALAREQELRQGDCDDLT